MEPLICENDRPSKGQDWIWWQMWSFPCSCFLCRMTGVTAEVSCCCTGDTVCPSPVWITKPTVLACVTGRIASGSRNEIHSEWSNLITWRGTMKTGKEKNIQSLPQPKSILNLLLKKKKKKWGKNVKNPNNLPENLHIPFISFSDRSCLCRERLTMVLILDWLRA